MVLIAHCSKQILSYYMRWMDGRSAKIDHSAAVAGKGEKDTIIIAFLR